MPSIFFILLISSVSHSENIDCGISSASTRRIEIEAPANESGESFRIEFEVPKKVFSQNKFPLIQSADYQATGKTEEGISYSKRLRVLFQKMPSLIKEKEFELKRNYGEEGYGYYRDLPFARTYVNKKMNYVSLLEPRYAQVEETEGGSLKTTHFSQLSEKEQGLAQMTSRMVFEAYMHCKAEYKASLAPKPKNWSEAVKAMRAEKKAAGSAAER